jgi:hypothetical protein
VRIAGRQPGPPVTATGRHYRIQINQDVAMRRPSALQGTAHTQHGQITEVTAGGHATIAGNGTMTLPARHPSPRKPTTHTQAQQHTNRHPPADAFNGTDHRTESGSYLR